MAHELVPGSTGSGKSTHVRESIRAYLEKAVSPEPIVWLDPQHGKSGHEFYQHCLALGLAYRTIFERLSDTDAVIKWDWLEESHHDHPLERGRENKREVELFLDALIRQREFTSLAEHALIKQWAENWSYLMLYQKPRKRLSDGIWAFRPLSPSWEKLIVDCQVAEIANRFKHLPTHPATLERMVSPALRLLDPIFNCPAVRCRDGMGHGFDVGEALDEGKILIFEGGDSSEEEISFLLRSIALRVIDYKRRGGQA